MSLIVAAQSRAMADAPKETLGRYNTFTHVGEEYQMALPWSCTTCTAANQVCSMTAELSCQFAYMPITVQVLIGSLYSQCHSVHTV